MENLRAENVGKCGIILESGDERQREGSQLKLNQSRIFSAEIDFPNIESILKISVKRSALLVVVGNYLAFSAFQIFQFCQKNILLYISKQQSGKMLGSSR